jgi:predicted metal-dependent phosphoesterase TrpH
MVSVESRFREVKASLHAHDLYSDGRNTPEQMVRAALNKGIIYFGISNHNTIEGQQRGLEEAEQINQSVGTLSMIYIISEEISTWIRYKGQLRSVDVHVSFPNHQAGLDYLREHRRFNVQPPLLPTIKNMLDRGANITLLHPNTRIVHGMPLDVVREVWEALDDQQHKRVAIEAMNWQTRFLPFRRLKEAEIIHLIQELGAPAVYFSDAHRAEDVGRIITLLQVDAFTPEALARAIAARRTKPKVEPLSWLEERKQLTAGAISAQIQTYQRRREKHDIMIPFPGNV